MSIDFDSVFAIDIITVLTQIIQTKSYVMNPKLIFHGEVDYKKIDQNKIIFIGYSCGGIYYSCLFDKNIFEDIFTSAQAIIYDASNTELIVYDENHDILFDYAFSYKEYKLYTSFLDKFDKARELIRIA